MPTADPITELLKSVDALITARSTGQDDAKPMASLVKSRLAVGEVTASDRQLLAVLEQQIATLFRPVISERDLCDILHCSSTWLLRERRQGRWLNFEVDARGVRHYTHEQILANLRGEKQKTNLKAA